MSAIPIDPSDDDEGISLLDLALPLAQHLKLLVIAPLMLALAAFGVASVIEPTFTARNVFLPPQQQQSSASAALSQLGALAGLTGAGASLKTPGDQYVSLMQSTTIADRLVDRFKLLELYDKKYRVDARKKLEDNSRITLGKKDGLITVEVDDTDPQRAAAMANQYVEELRSLTSGLALTEAQQRRSFFESQLKQTKDRLTTAQEVLQASGFNEGALKSEPKSAAEGYARLRANVTAAEIRLLALRRSLSEDTPEVQQQQALVSALRSELNKAEKSTDLNAGPDYVSKYREFKYQETLFELFSKQYEAARLDESREGQLIQVVDTATAPEKKSKPKRMLITLGAGVLAFVLLAGWVVTRHFWRQSSQDPETAAKLAQLRQALGHRPTR